MFSCTTIMFTFQISELLSKSVCSDAFNSIHLIYIKAFKSNQHKITKFPAHQTHLLRYGVLYFTFHPAI